MTDKKCAPGKIYSEGSCFTLEDLIHIAKSYNNLSKTTKIKIINDKKYLLKQLTTFLKNDYNCDNQICWLNIVKNDNNIKNFTFRPTGPKKQYEWLSTKDINLVMIQYEKKYPEFKFFGAIPYDFEDIKDLEIANINFNELINNGKNKIGVVFNLDEHYKSGSHWVSLYADLQKKQIYYFDSFGINDKGRIYKFCNKIKSYFLSKNNSNKNIDYRNNKNIDYRYNKIQHQFKNTECGVYSMNFLIRLLNGETFDNITNNITDDIEMNSCRKVYFRN
jgi:hypothetical protein